MRRMYCGNNRLYRDLLNGSAYIGTRYKCLQRGIGIGRTLPYDPRYLDDYAPIFEDKIYCGNSDLLPDEYSRFGTLYDCHRRGVSIGKKITVDNYESGISRRRSSRRRRTRSKARRRSSGRRSRSKSRRRSSRRRSRSKTRRRSSG